MTERSPGPEERADSIVLAAVTLAATAGLLVCTITPARLDSAGRAALGVEVDMRLNVNTASAGALQALPGVGPALSGAIVAERESGGGFEGVADLERVKGIGPVIRGRLEPYVVAE